MLADPRRLASSCCCPNKANTSRDSLDPLRLHQGWVTGCLHSHLGGDGVQGAREAFRAISRLHKPGRGSTTPPPSRPLPVEPSRAATKGMTAASAAFRTLPRLVK